MNNIIVGLYVRVSTQEQAKEGYSIEEQKARLTKYSEAQDWTVARIYEDPGFSGAKLERPAIQDLIADVEDHKLNKVVVYKLDRLSRSQKDTLYLIEDVFLKNDVDFVSMTENFDTSTPFGKATVGILSVFAQLEREQITERMLMGKVGRAKTGRALGTGNTATGYIYEDGRLKPDPYYADVVRRMFKEYNSGRPLKNIARDLNDDNILSRSGRKWTGSNIGSILRHRVYVGDVEYRGEIYPGTHEPIIDRETFDKAQARLAESKETDPNYLHFSDHASFLSGKCYCVHCQAKKFIATDISKSGGTVKYITCQFKKKKHCPDKRVPLKTVEELVKREIRHLKLDPNYLKAVRTNSQETDERRQIESINKHIEDNEKKIKRLTDLYVVEGIDLADVKEQIEALSRENNSNRKKVKALKENVKESLSDAQITTLADAVDTADDEELKIIVDALIDRIDFSGDTITIRWAF